MPGPQSTGKPQRSVAASLHVNQRTLQCALGVLWILDGLLKFQPDLFKPSFVSDLISPMAAGQPWLIGSTISHMANFLSHEATMWVAVFGLVEIAIGVGLLFRRSVKPALVASFIWGAGIYLFGEGFGMVFTGQTSPLQGAPGAVCFYVLLGLLVWPRSDQGSNRVRTGPQSSAAARGVFGGTGSLLVWAGIWIFQAIIWLFPFNRTANAVTDQMTDTANGEPGWYAHFLNSFGHAFVGAGIWVAVILAALSMVIGLGPLISKRPGPYIGLGIALALLYWVTGEGVGELLTFSGTDPNNGPLLALIGLSVLPDGARTRGRTHAGGPVPGDESAGRAELGPGRHSDPVSGGDHSELVRCGCLGYLGYIVDVLHVGHVHVRIGLGHAGDVNRTHGKAIDKSRPRSPHEHGRHGGSRGDRSTLELHRTSTASRRSGAVDHRFRDHGPGSQDANAEL